ncbi:hypothetical protein [Megasphaera massiliensis]|uniref:hypothetical protein n=1 Tax=Megasphaera massiliensis TaxID=1232428 RepID=UPI0005A9465A|nr:hypothetical protein [Megasphaera massiliensis]
MKWADQPVLLHFDAVWSTLTHIDLHCCMLFEMWLTLMRNFASSRHLIGYITHPLTDAPVSKRIVHVMKSCLAFY